MRRRLLNGRLMLFLGLLTSMCWMMGCGPAEKPTGSVSGKVTYNGEPLTKGSVLFVNEETGIGASGQLDTSGTYTIASIRTGEYQVAIQPPPAPSPDEMEEGAQPEKLDIPEKYLSPQTSGLTATVTEGENTADFELQ